MTPRARPRGDDLNTQSSLAKLRWVAEKDLMYDATSRTLHRAAPSVGSSLHLWKRWSQLAAQALSAAQP